MKNENRIMHQPFAPKLPEKSKPFLFIERSPDSDVIFQRGRIHGMLFIFFMLPLHISHTIFKHKTCFELK
jgi:hypothetical protein